MPNTPTRESEGGNHTDDNHADESRLLNHVFGTYNWLRFGTATIAFAFPLLLWVWGWKEGLPLQGSMSAYYWASIEGDPPVRVLFVGGIFALGSFLFLYKGYSRWEDQLLNLAAVLVILVALFPTSWKCGSELGYCSPWRLHYASAMAFFACIVIVALLLSGTTLREIQDQGRRRRYEFAYWLTRGSLIFFPGLAIAAHVLTKRSDTLTFFLELAGIWAFASFWLVKTFELLRSQTEMRVREAVRRSYGSGSRQTTSAN